MPTTKQRIQQLEAWHRRIAATEHNGLAQYTDDEILDELNRIINDKPGQLTFNTTPHLTDAAITEELHQLI